MENKEIMSTQDMEFIREDGELMRFMAERYREMKVAEQERLDTEIKYEAAKYQMHLRKVRHMYHNVARATATLTGASSVITGMYFLDSNTPGVLIAAVCTFGLASLSNHFDKRSRKKW